jgi:hypothetical protein
MTKTFKIKPLLIDLRPGLRGWFLFDPKTAPCYNQLIFNVFFIALQLANCFNPGQLFPFYTQLSQPQLNGRFGRKLKGIIKDKMPSISKY